MPYLESIRDTTVNSWISFTSLEDNEHLDIVATNDSRTNSINEALERVAYP